MSVEQDKPAVQGPQKPPPTGEEGVFHIRLLSLDEMLRHLPARSREEVVKAWRLNNRFVTPQNLEIIKARLRARGEDINDPEISRQLTAAGFDLPDTKAS